MTIDLNTKLNELLNGLELLSFAGFSTTDNKIIINKKQVTININTISSNTYSSLATQFQTDINDTNGLQGYIVSYGSPHIQINDLKYLNPTTPPPITLIPTRCRNILNMNSFYHSDYSNNHSNFHEKYKGKIMVKYESNVKNSTDISFTNTQFLTEDLQKDNHYRLILKLYKLQHHFLIQILTTIFPQTFCVK